MKIFIYKTVIIILSVYLLFEFTVGRRIDMYENHIKTLSNKTEREKIIDKIKEEISKANQKENILTESEKELLSTFINKIKKELNISNSQ